MKKKFKFLKTFFIKKPKLLSKINLRRLLVLTYLFLILLGIILFFLGTFTPIFITCSTLFGEKFCTPTGFFLITIASIPGYLITVILLNFLPEPSLILTLLMTIGTSLLFYFLLGFLIDKFLVERLRNKLRVKLSANLLTKYLIYFLFIALLTLLVFFYTR